MLQCRAPRWCQVESSGTCTKLGFPSCLAMKCTRREVMAAWRCRTSHTGISLQHISFFCLQPGMQPGTGSWAPSVCQHLLHGRHSASPVLEDGQCCPASGHSAQRQSHQPSHQQPKFQKKAWGGHQRGVKGPCRRLSSLGMAWSKTACSWLSMRLTSLTSLSAAPRDMHQHGCSPPRKHAGMSTISHSRDSSGRRETPDRAPPLCTDAWQLTKACLLSRQLMEGVQKAGYCNTQGKNETGCEVASRLGVPHQTRDRTCEP